MNNTELVTRFIKGRGQDRGKCGNLRICTETQRLFSYDMPIAQWLDGTLRVVIYDELPSQTTRRHQVCVCFVAMPIRPFFVPWLNATREETIAYYCDKLAAIEKRWMRSRNRNTLTEYAYMYRRLKEMIPEFPNVMPNIMFVSAHMEGLFNDE